MVKKKKSSRGGKQSKKRMTIAVLVAEDGSKPCNPVVSELLRCFRKLTVATYPAGLHYFASTKSWMNAEIMEHIIDQLDRQLKLENSQVILFLDNARSHPETLQDPLEFIKLAFLPKHTSCRLQLPYAGIIRYLKAKYRKR